MSDKQTTIREHGLKKELMTHKSNLESFANKVYLADARNMEELPDESVGLIVTSPPYFNVKNYALDGKQDKRHSKSKAGQIGDISEFNTFIEELLQVWAECVRVLKPNGKLVINVPLMPMLKAQFSTHENRHIFDLNSEIQHSILRGLPNVHLLDTYIWNRTNPSKKLMFGSYPYPSNFYAQNTVEFVTVYVKEGKAIQPSKEIKDASRLSQEEWVDFTKQIWNLPIPGKGDLAFGEHAALMPEQLAERCIRLFSFVGEIVLDPFAGSGTTLRVAKSLDRKYVGYELMGEYASIIERKVQQGICVNVTRKKNSSPKITEAFSLQTRLAGLESKAILDKVQVGPYEKLLSKVPDGYIDLVAVDPPYNMKKGDWDSFESDDAFQAFTKKWISEAHKKLKPGGSIYVFNTARNCAYILSYLEELGFVFQNWITWNKKDGFTSTKTKFLPESESIIFATKPGAKHTFNHDQVRIPYDSTSRILAAQKTGIIKNGKRWYPNPDGRLCPDVWVIPSARHSEKENGKLIKSEHPTVKPLALMERIVLASSNQGEVVLDFFAGSGTTLVAAAKNGRHFIGCDISADYAKLSRKRLKELKVTNES
jgi:site-specific DNA-methyltransferase (cytosine-N4-specific)